MIIGLSFTTRLGTVVVERRTKCLETLDKRHEAVPRYLDPFGARRYWCEPAESSAGIMMVEQALENGSGWCKHG
ncbi:MAG: hypothetical protein AAFT19_10715 [Pseudomonadota bacterium]